MLGLLLALLGVTSADAMFWHGGVSNGGGGSAPSTPTAVQVILQGETSPNHAAFYNTTAGTAPSSISNASPNFQEIGWHSVAGASSYNIYDNGTMIASVSSATAASNYSTYASQQTGTTCANGSACAVAPGIDSAYSDTTATSVVGTFLTNGFLPIMHATGSISSGSLHTLNITAMNSNLIVAGQNINSCASPGPGCTTGGAGLGNNASLIGTLGATCADSSGTPTGTGGTGTYCLTSPATANETGITAYIASNGAFSITVNLTSGQDLFTVTAITPMAIVAGQGIGGPGIPVGTIIAPFGTSCDGSASTGTGGTGTYCLYEVGTTTLVAASGAETGQTYGTVYLVSQPHLMQVTAVVGGVESALSAYAILPFVTNGSELLSAGVFTSGSLQTNVPAPATTPLGYSTVAGWNVGFSGQGSVSNGSTTLTISSVTSGGIIPGVTVSDAMNDIPGGTKIVSQLTGTQGGIGTYQMSASATGNSGTEAISVSGSQIINTYTGNSAASYNLGAAGYAHLCFDAYTTQSGATLNYEPEIAGDGQLEAVTTFATQGYTSPLVANTWNHVDIPMAGSNGIYLDSSTGFLGKTNVAQTSFYKITWGASVTLTAPIYVEIYLSVGACL